MITPNEAPVEVRREVKSLTNRIRKALRDLPKDLESGREPLIADTLREIMGGAAGIADLLDIEL